MCGLTTSALQLLVGNALLVPRRTWRFGRCPLDFVGWMEIGPLVDANVERGHCPSGRINELASPLCSLFSTRTTTTNTTVLPSLTPKIFFYARFLSISNNRIERSPECSARLRRISSRYHPTSSSLSETRPRWRHRSTFPRRCQLTFRTSLACPRIRPTSPRR